MTNQRIQRGRDDRPGRGRRISVRSVRRSPEDYHKVARALIALVAAEAAAEAEAAERPDAEASPGSEVA